MAFVDTFRKRCPKCGEKGLRAPSYPHVSINPPGLEHWDEMEAEIESTVGLKMNPPSPNSSISLFWCPQKGCGGLFRQPLRGELSAITIDEWREYIGVEPGPRAKLDS